MDEKFSVVISVYKNDKGDFFEEAVNSIINQETKPTEIIIVIDGPLNDDVRVKVESLKQHPLVQVIELKENVGRGRARDAAIRATKYDLIALMDSDDISVRSRFKQQLALMHHQNLDIVGGMIEEFKNEIGDLGTFRKVPTTDLKIRNFAKWRQPMNHVTIMFKKEVYERVGGYKDLRYLEDFDFFARLLNSDARFGNINETLVHVRFSDTQFYRRKGGGYSEEEKKVLKEMFQSGFLSWPEYVVNLLARGIIRKLSSSTIRHIYTSLLRKDHLNE